MPSAPEANHTEAGSWPPASKTLRISDNCLGGHED